MGLLSQLAKPFTSAARSAPLLTPGAVDPAVEALRRMSDGIEQRSNTVWTDYSSAAWMMGLLGMPTAPGVHVTEENAMTCDAVYACIRIISARIQTLPIHVHKGRDGRVDSHPILRLLAAEPNPDMTAATFWEAFLVNLLVNGNGYAVIVRDKAGAVKSLYPLKSCQTRAVRENGQLWYQTITNGKNVKLWPEQVLHVMNMTSDGVCGTSPIQTARESIGLALALQEFAGKFFANGANGGGFIEIPKGDPDAIDKWVKSFQAQYQGLQNAYKTICLFDGMKYTSGGVDPEKAQALQSRLYQLRAIARVYQVPLHMIGDLERATFSNIEHQGIEFRQNTIEPWTTRIEQELNRKLLASWEIQEGRGLKFNLDALLKSDTKTRYEAHNLALQGGWKTVNEVRALEGLPPVPGGDVLRVPLNMAPIDKANQADPAAASN